MKNHTFDRRLILALSLLIVCMGTVAWLSWWRKPATQKEAQPWMTVFVHGSFGTTLGLFSVFNVIKDNVDNTNYKKMTSHMRHDPFFYQLQPILSPGFFPVTPTFTPPNQEHKPVVQPVSAAYQKITEHIAPNTQNQFFYTFGWSGLVSQERRRKEALRLYNMLSKEYARLRAQGITPKIRLIAHSHGGNVVLNMGGIHELLVNNMVKPNKTQYPDDDHRASMEKLHSLLKEAKTEGEISNAPHQKKWDYTPTAAPFQVDEYILLGTPVQPETSPFFLCPFFKKIYHFYSDNDVIQGMDWVSTRRYYSEQRVPCMPINQQKGPRIIQAKITLNKPTDQEQQIKQPTGPPPKEHGATINMATLLSDTATSLWSSLFGSGKKTILPDPNHKELWFMGWRKKDGQYAQDFIRPYPFAIMIPFFQHLIAQKPDETDFDIRLKFKDDAIDLISYPHDGLDKQKKLSVPRTLLKSLQDAIAPWQPVNYDPGLEMNILHRYSKMLNL